MATGPTAITLENLSGARLYEWNLIGNETTDPLFLDGAGLIAACVHFFGTFADYVFIEVSNDPAAAWVQVNDRAGNPVRANANNVMIDFDTGALWVRARAAAGATTARVRISSRA